MAENIGPLLGIDYGLQRTGLAISNAGATLAFPLCTLELACFGNRSALLDEIALLAQKHHCNAIVMGLPLHSDGSENVMCKTVRKAAKKMERRTFLPIHFMPEILSSELALANLHAAGLRGLLLKRALDQEAARIILQSWIDSAYGKLS